VVSSLVVRLFASEPVSVFLFAYMNDELQSRTEPGVGPEFLSNLWDEHMRHEFATHNTEDTLATMVDDAYVNHIPVLTGGVGKDALREFYSKRFIPQMPPDTEVTPVSRTVGADQLVDEMIFKFTHTVRMDWMLPGISPTGVIPSSFVIRASSFSLLRSL
jgi:carboxymethylenebutenolidase